MPRPWTRHLPGALTKYACMPVSLCGPATERVKIPQLQQIILCYIYYIHSQTNNLTNISFLTQIWPIDIAFNLLTSLLIINTFMTDRISQSLTAYPQGLGRYRHSCKRLPRLWYDNHWETLWTKLDILRVKWLILPEWRSIISHSRHYLFQGGQGLPSSGLESPSDSTQVAMQIIGTWELFGL